MKFLHFLCHRISQILSIKPRNKMGSVRLLVLGAALLALLLMGCGCSTLGGGDTPSQPQAVDVNFFGTAANHTHTLIALPGNVLMLATHFGLFRSSDGGKYWTLVAAGPTQGMMTNWLAASSLSRQRLYVMTFPAIVTPLNGALGVYTSADEGRTWQLTITSAQLGNDNFIVQPGNQSPDQVYVYVNVLGTQGLKVSEDAGQHFTTVGALPFGDVQGLLAVPGAPGTLLVYGDEGAARSTDGGMHWTVIASLNQQAVFGITTAGPHRPIYASADDGIYASQDGGANFTLVYPGASYSALTASPADPQLVYGKTATTIFRSADGGHTWNALPPPTGSQGSLYALAADPTNPALLYLGLSYPTEVYRYNQDSSQPWTSLTPPATTQPATQPSMLLIVAWIITLVLLVAVTILFMHRAKARRSSKRGL
jgi:photosystem II stability/assembly factor-like uncharacterized protein